MSTSGGAVGIVPLPVGIAAGGTGQVAAAAALAALGGIGPAALVGLPTVRAFPFVWNSAGILTGHTLYVPTVADVILAAWVRIVTAWDGVTPLIDVGTGVGLTTGMFANTAGGPVQADLVDNELIVGTGFASQNSGASRNSSITSAQLEVQPRGIPGLVTVANPLKVWVSQNGQNNGADPVPSQGAGIVYLVTATPV